MKRKFNQNGRPKNYPQIMGQKLIVELMRPNNDVRLEEVKRYIGWGADLTVTNQSGHTPLMIAVWGERLDVVQTLLKAGANPKYTNYYNETVLHHAVWAGDLEILREILKHNVNVNTCNDKQNTPLMTAAWQGRIDQVMLLVEHGADLNIRDIEDKTAQIIAEEAGHDNIAEYLAFTPARRAQARQEKIEAGRRQIKNIVKEGLKSDVKKPSSPKFKKKRNKP